MRQAPIVLVVVAFAGCGGGAEDGRVEPAAGAGGPAVGGEAPSGGAADTQQAGAGKPSAIEMLGITGPEQKPWDEMTFDEREFYMIGKVLPISKEIFQQFDAKEYAEFGCESCHGAKAEANEFAMPAEELPIIPPADSSGYDILEDGKSRMVGFMEDKVTPTVQTLLGVDEFGCNDCHPSS